MEPARRVAAHRCLSGAEVPGRPGIASPAIATRTAAPTRLGKTVVIAVQDDHSRLVYAELHSSRERGQRLDHAHRGAAWMREQGCGPLEAVMSDNAKCYTGHAFAAHARRARRPPHPHPALHAALERQDRAFFGTLEDEWAHGRVWPDSATRDRALSSFIRYFNRYRPHSAAGGRATHHPRSPSPRGRTARRRSRRRSGPGRARRRRRRSPPRAAPPRACDLAASTEARACRARSKRSASALLTATSREMPHSPQRRNIHQAASPAGSQRDGLDEVAPADGTDLESGAGFLAAGVRRLMVDAVSPSTGARPTGPPRVRRCGRPYAGCERFPYAVWPAV